MPELDFIRRVAAAASSRASYARGVAMPDARRRADLDQLLGSVLELEGDVPLVLLPVRVEVRSTADSGALRVRIFHDSVHVESLDEGVSESERAAGIAYWTLVWQGADTSMPWPMLVEAVGSRRAPWVAESLRPRNVGARASEPPDFPDTAPTDFRTAVVRTLPDRFFVRIEQDGALPVTVSGGVIDDELPVGLVRPNDLRPLELDDQDLPLVDESLRWLVDYTEAERVGLAVTVPLPLPGRPVRRLTVYGVRATLDSASSAARFARLIRAHSFTDGAEFIAQGTPTNNTESIRAGWSRRTPLGSPVLDPTADTALDTNAAVSAAALGIDRAVMSKLPGADDRPQARAAAFNTALWSTTWGDAIEHLTPEGQANGDQRLDSPSLEAVRDHWVAHVRGRGPLPVLRLGRQPYGLLPIVATDAAWRPLQGGFIEESLVPFLNQSVRWMWTAGGTNAVTVMNQALDTALPQILGTDAILRGLRVRTALSPNPLVTAAAFVMPDLGDPATEQQVTRALLLLSGVADNALDDHDLLGKKTRTLALPLVHESDVEFVNHLLHGPRASMTPQSVLQVLLAHADAIDQHRRDTIVPASMHGVVREAIASNRSNLDAGLLAQALDAVLVEGAVKDPVVGKAALHVVSRIGRLDPRVVADRHPIPAIAPETMVEKIGGEGQRIDRLSARQGMQAIGELFCRASWSASVRSSLELIATIESLEERRLLLSETLDCCSHRLDAWLTSAASLRLSSLRANGAQGMYFGAYGWLENITLNPPDEAGEIDDRPVFHDRADGGYVYAPSLMHATAAAILRSGRLTHRHGDPNAEALEIDLSSARTRDALALLGGMRRGQSLGALLGYRLERRLHEASGNGLELDRFIYVLRALAPLRAGKLTSPGETAEESVAASDVVDGLRLMELDPETIKKKLALGPDNTRYLVPPDAWKPPKGGEEQAVLAAIVELERSHDAVADLLLAESVYQIAAGNPARAAAALDVLGAGEALPPEPEVARTPRSGVPIQHRIVVLVPDPAPRPIHGWNTISPRARVEPRLDRWAQGALGDPRAILLDAALGTTLADAELSALDVLYDADGDSLASSTLAARLRANPRPLGDDFAHLAPIWELASMLRALLTSGRALDVCDLGRAVEEGAQGRKADVAELRERATEAVRSFKAACASDRPLQQLASFGVRPPPTVSKLALTDAEQAQVDDALRTEAASRLKVAESLLAQAEGAPSSRGAVELISKAIGGLFGGSFVVVPRWLPPPPNEHDPWSEAVGPGGVSARPGADIRPWLARAGALRACASSLGETLLVREALGQRPRLRVVQSPADAYGTWAGLPFANGQPPTRPLTCIVAEVTGADAGHEPSLAGAVAGLVLDEWTEIVPRRLERSDPRDPNKPAELVDIASTGIALNANAPGARPPQALLIALSPDGGDWTNDRLVQVLDEARALAQMRTLTLQQIPFAGRYLPALYFRDWSLQGEPVIDWVKLKTQYAREEVLQFLEVDH
ncbi:MAG: hypothetical protein QM778_18470 [Myxococcales bacterium]